MSTLKCDNSKHIIPAQTLLRQLCQPTQVARMLCTLARQRDLEKARIDKVRIVRCWPGRNGSYLFEWSFECDGQTVHLYGRYPVEAARDQHAERIDDSSGETSLRHGISSTLPRWQTTVFSRDCDSGLPQVSACLDSQKAAAVASMFPRGALLREARLLAYKPGRRATIHYTLRSRGRRSTPLHAAGKTFRDDRGRRILKLHEQAHSQLKRIGASLTVPAPLGYIESLQLAVLEWIVAADGSQRQPGSSDYVLALADLHRIEMDGLPSHTVDAERAVIRLWQDHLQVMCPADADRFEPLVEELCRQGPEMESVDRCVIHRDFYERQLLAGAKGPVLIDLDTLALGDRCVDLGNLAAHLALTRLAAGERVRSNALCQEVVDLYEQSGQSVNRGRLDYFTAASMFRVAAVHAVRTATRRCARPLARLAAELMSVKLPSKVGVMT